MRVLIIEQDETKYKHIKDSLNRVLSSPWIGWERAKLDGLVTIMRHNVEHKFSGEYDLVITGDYMPYSSDYNLTEKIKSGEVEIKPYAKELIDEVRDRFELDNLPIVVCTSGVIDECDYNYLIKYDPSSLLDETLKAIIEDIIAYQALISETNTTSISPKREIDYTGVVGTALLEHKTQVVDYCSSYDPFGLCNIMECLYCENAAFKITVNGESITFNEDKKDITVDTDPHEILFYDRVPAVEEIYGYLFSEDSRFKIIRKSDNIVMVDHSIVKEKTKTLNKKR